MWSVFLYTALGMKGEWTVKGHEGGLNEALNWLCLDSGCEDRKEWGEY